MQPTTNTQSTFNPIAVIVPNGAIKGPTGDPNDGGVYPDGTFLIVLAEMIDDNCVNENLLIRMIQTNGTVNRINLNVKFPSINFCKWGKSLTDDGKGAEIGFRWTATPFGGVEHYFVIGYLDYDQSKSEYRWKGIIGNQYGEILVREIDLGSPFQANGQVYGMGTFTPNFNGNGGFLATLYSGLNQLSWIEYDLPKNGQVNLIANGTKGVPGFHNGVAFSTVDGGYGAAYAIKSSNYSSSEMINPFWTVRVCFLRPVNSEVTNEFIIFQTTVPFNLITIDACSNAYDGTGYHCYLRILSPSASNDTVEYNVVISFLSTGSTTQIQKIRTKYGQETNRVTNAYTLYYGGVILNDYDLTNDTSEDITQVTDMNGILRYNVTMPINKISFLNVLRNNTAIVITGLGDETGWGVYAVDIEKFLSEKGYKNPLVDSTLPAIGQNVPIRTKNISITYNNELELSSGNISIYRVYNDSVYLRQTASGFLRWSTLSNNSKTVTLNVLDSTFNQPNSTYFVTLDANYVISKITLEPLMGVDPNIWTFTTGSFLNEMYADTTIALLRLTSEATTTFENLSKNEKSDFLRNLTLDITQAIPVEPDRIVATNRYQLDPTTEEPQILISLRIIAPSDASQSNVESVRRDLDTLIRNKEITPIAFGKYSALLDDTYGFPPTLDIWEQIKPKLFIFGIIIMILFVLYAVGRFRFPEENSENSKFHQWFKAHTQIASIFTVISSADVEALSLLSSCFTGLSIFSAPISPKAELRIFYGSTVNIFIEDLPQFVIQEFSDLDIISDTVF
ncbi:5215_t:CDS:10 [Ambispora leptoticha]|uniref:5215_t:CDS:1 n=1 Tax=Ambispora leptoticha TaxID=144679 RepID=A0A9N9A5C0_9GLOM|nr:5215_t:CDS:10 [Ambispora leptoticha]